MHTKASFLSVFYVFCLSVGAVIPSAAIAQENIVEAEKFERLSPKAFQDTLQGDWIQICDVDEKGVSYDFPYSPGNQVLIKSSQRLISQKGNIVNSIDFYFSDSQCSQVVFGLQTTKVFNFIAVVDNKMLNIEERTMYTFLALYDSTVPIRFWNVGTTGIPFAFSTLDEFFRSGVSQKNGKWEEMPVSLQIPENIAVSYYKNSGDLEYQVPRFDRQGHELPSVRAKFVRPPRKQQ